MTSVPAITSRQRVLDVFAGQSADRVPIAHIGFSSRAAALILGREAYVGGGIQLWREAAAWCQSPAAHQEFVQRSLTDAVALSRATDQDLLRWEYWRLPEMPTAQLDEHTFLFGRRDAHWRIHRLAPNNETFPVIKQGGPPTQPRQSADDLQREVEELEEKSAGQPFDQEKLIASIGQMRQAYPEMALRCSAGFLCIPYDDPLWLEAALVRPDLMQRYLHANLCVELRRIAALVAGGAKLIFGGGDMASNIGPMYSPQVFHDLILPCLQQLAQACHENGAYFLFASDGNLWPVAGDLFGISGVDGYYEIDRRAGMDLRQLRERFPHLTLVGGNISSQTVAQGTVDQVIVETRDCLETARDCGRILVGMSNYAVPETPAANLHAMFETIAKYR